jgi:flagellar hook-basal body complex protein FliE
MDTKARIKVIKRSDQSSVKVSKEKPISARASARKMVSTVTGWVNEFQQKSREETQEALRKLFPEMPKPSDCPNC